MQEGQLLMTQADRDRLVALKKAKKSVITQREAAEELGVSVRQVQRLLDGLRQRGDKAVVHGLRGKPSNRKIEEEIEREAVKILSVPVYAGFGPTLAAEYLKDKHGIEASKETVRQWMMRGKLWRGRETQVRELHTWRPRRSRFGELVQWDTSDHDWLEGRGEKLYLIAMIDDATSRLFPATRFPQFRRLPGPSVGVFQAWRNLSGPMGVQNQNQSQNQILGRDRAASRWSAPSPGQRTRREEHAPSHRPQMSSGRLFLDRVARQHCPSPLHRRSQINTHSRAGHGKRRHFYFARNTTFLLCLDSLVRCLDTLSLLRL
jgi:transposase